MPRRASRLARLRRDLRLLWNDANPARATELKLLIAIELSRQNCNGTIFLADTLYTRMLARPINEIESHELALTTAAYGRALTESGHDFDPALYRGAFTRALAVLTERKENTVWLTLAYIDSMYDVAGLPEKRDVFWMTILHDEMTRDDIVSKRLLHVYRAYLAIVYAAYDMNDRATRMLRRLSVRYLPPPSECNLACIIREMRQSVDDKQPFIITHVACPRLSEMLCN